MSVVAFYDYYYTFVFPFSGFFKHFFSFISSPCGRKRIPTSAVCRISLVNHYLLHMRIVICRFTVLAIQLFSNLPKSESTLNIIHVHLRSLVSLKSKGNEKRSIDQLHPR